MKSIDENKFNELYTEYKQRRITKVQFADKLNISRPTLDKLLKDKKLM